MIFIREQVGTTKRKPISDSKALAIWEAHKGICILCDLPIDGAKEDWFVEHRRALELGGTNDDANLGPAHYRCKPEKDAADHQAAAMAKRRKKPEIGIKAEPERKIEGRGFPASGKTKTPKASLPPRRLYADDPIAPRTM